ncbi:MAG: hypothetical protein IKT14_04550 [Clostridiales bacterium]|nr:hypothetical protein [Clostridiales bacterium]
MKGFLTDNSSEMCTRVAPVFAAMGDKVADYNWLFTDMSGWDSIFAKYEHYGDGDYYFVKGDVMKKLMSENRLATMNWGVISGFDKDIDLAEITDSDLPFADGNKELWTAPLKTMHEKASVEIIVTDITKLAFKAQDDELVDTVVKAFPRSVDLEGYCTRMMRKREKTAEKETKEEKKGGFFKKLFG